MFRGLIYYEATPIANLSNVIFFVSTIAGVLNISHDVCNVQLVYLNQQYVIYLLKGRNILELEEISHYGKGYIKWHTTTLPRAKHIYCFQLITDGNQATCLLIFNIEGSSRRRYNWGCSIESILHMLSISLCTGRVVMFGGYFNQIFDGSASMEKCWSSHSGLLNVLPTKMIKLETKELDQTHL